MLNVVIGLILIFLLYSLFATTVLELLAGLLAFRGHNLEKALRNMLDSEGTGLFEEFKENPLYQQLAGKFVGKKTPPSYLPPEKFRSILFQLFSKKEEGEELSASIGKLPDGSLKTVLQQLMEDAKEDKGAFKDKVELWFNDVMDRASGWYKRRMKTILVFLGLAIAASFNVDSLHIYGQLSRDPETANKLAMEATRVVESQEGIEAESDSFKQEVYEMIEENMETLKSPLGIGWESVDEASLGWSGWVYKAFGWFVTALAISLGAPFWFDLLRKMVNIRSAGNSPDGKG